MPDTPLWYDRLEDAIKQLEDGSDPWVDRARLESLLGIGRRRAQQILRPLVCQTVGRSGLADRGEVIDYLRRLAAGEPAFHAQERRRRFAATLDGFVREAQEQPRVLVEAPTRIVDQQLDDLPPGVHLAPGQIRIEGFRTAEEAMKKLLALAMAMGNDPIGFDARITLR